MTSMIGLSTLYSQTHDAAMCISWSSSTAQTLVRGDMKQLWHQHEGFTIDIHHNEIDEKKELFDVVMKNDAYQ